MKIYNDNQRPYTITTTDAHRQRRWLRIFGTITLPVIHPYPSLKHFKNSHADIYQLDTNAISSTQRYRLAADIGRRLHIPYDLALEIVADGIPILSQDCYIVTDQAIPSVAESRP